MVATGYQHCGCKYEDPRQEAQSHVSYEWTRRHVAESTRAFLESLPFRIDLRPLGGHIGGPSIILVHGAPTMNTLYWTEDRPDAFCAQMARLAGAKAGDTIVFGHTHKPWRRAIDGIQFINAGSVGRPKDGDWRACYLSLEIGEHDVEAGFVRVEYDLEEAARGIEASELPDDSAEYLRRGGA